MPELMKDKTLQGRKTGLDVIRVFAIVSVIMTHASAPFAGRDDVTDAMFFWGNLFDGLSRLGVPLFTMLSGALLLDEEKEISVKDVLLSRIPRLLLVLFAWTTVYAACYQLIIPVLKGNGFSLKAFLFAIVKGHYHLWFLYMLAGLYLALPLVRLFVKKANREMVLYYIAVSVLVNCLVPITETLAREIAVFSHVKTFLEKFQLGFFNIYLTYYLLGWYAVHIGVPQKAKRLLTLGGILSAILVLVSSYFTRDLDNTYSNSSLFVLVYSLWIFMALYEKFNGLTGKAAALLVRLSKLSFGMYAVHVLILNSLKYPWEVSGFNRAYPLVCMVALFIDASLLSALAAFLISKIPLLNKTIRC